MKSFPVAVLPTYNEKDNITKILPLILKQNQDLHVLVVDDSSPDQTPEEVKAIQKKANGRIHLIVRRERGRGSAVICGFKKALELGATHIFEMDADFSHDPNDIKRFIHEMGDADVVVGSRFLPGGGIQNRSLLRNGLSLILNKIIRQFLGLKISDASGGFRLFKRHVLESLDFNQIISKNYSFCPELLYRVKNRGFIIKEVPILFVNRKAGKSKANLRISLDYLFNVVRIRLF